MKQDEFARGIVAFSRFIVEFPVAIDKQLEKWVEREYITQDVSDEAKEPWHKAFAEAVNSLPYAPNVKNEEGIQRRLTSVMEDHFLNNNENAFWVAHTNKFVTKILEKTWQDCMHPVVHKETLSEEHMKNLENCHDFDYAFQLPITALAIVTETLNDFISPDPSNPYSPGWWFGAWSPTSHGPLCKLEADVGDREITGLRIEAGGYLFDQHITFKTYKSGRDSIPLEGPTDKQIVHQFRVSLDDIKSGKPRNAEQDQAKIGLTEMKDFCWQALATLGIEKPTYGKPELG